MKVVRVGHSLKNLDLMEGILQILKQCFRCTKKGVGFLSIVARVASVSVWFRSKERPRNRILGLNRARNETRAKKLTGGKGVGKRFLPFFPPPPPPRSFT